MENQKIDIQHFKDLLEKEQERLLAGLKTVGRVNPENPKDWEPVPEESDGDTSDPNDLADNIEDYEGNTAVLKQLETELNDVRVALSKIEKGEYGICEESGEPIEIERLEANPAAKTCLKHSK